MIEIFTLILLVVVFSLGLRAVLKGNELFTKIHGETTDYSEQLKNQLGYFDQYIGMLISSPEKYSIYRPELLPYIRATRMAIRDAVTSLISYIIYLMFINAI